MEGLTPEQVKDILLKATNKDFERQEDLIHSLESRIDRLLDRGLLEYTPYITEMSKIIETLNEKKKAQEEYVKDFYDRVSKKAGGVDLDMEALAALIDYKAFAAEIADAISKNKESESNAKSAGKIDEGEEFKREWEAKKTDLENRSNELIDKYKHFGYVKDTVDEIKAQALDKDASKGLIEELKQVNILNEELLAQKRDFLEKERMHNSIVKDRIKAYKALNVFWKELKAQIVDGGNLWLKYNAQAIADAKRLGITSIESARAYMGNLMENSKALARNFGMSAEQAMKLQENYAKVTGRATLLTRGQMEDIAASSKLMGQETVMSAMQIMDNMGTTSEKATELIDKNYARAVNSGLDTVKASEEFVKNLSLANKLTFRSGVDGISKMTALSQKIRLNLQEVANVADKFNTIEGAIEGSAKLQVLGGAAAMYGSNPMTMLHEALADPEALFERMGKMFGQQAYFDRKLGESRIAPLQLAFIKEQAKAMGMSYDEAVNTAKQQAKIKDIEYEWKVANPTAFSRATEEERSKIANLAHFDTATQTWKVSYNDMMGVQRDIDVKSIDAATMRDIMSDNIEPVEDIKQNVRRIATALVGTKERWESMIDQYRTAKAQFIDTPMWMGDSALRGVNGSSLWGGPAGLTSGKFFSTGVGMIGYPLLMGGSAYFGGRIAKSVGSKVGGRLFGSTAAPAAANTTAPLAGSSAGGATTGGTTAASRAASVIPRAGAVANAAMGTAIAVQAVQAGIDFAKGQRAYSRGVERFTNYTQGRNAVTQRERYTTIERQAVLKDAENEKARYNSRVTGRTIGAVAGGVIGFAVGGPMGAAVGTTIGGWLGKQVGNELAGTKSGTDLLGRHISDIQKGDTEDNVKRMVLPIESIDYNVSLIANQLGIISAAPSRGNIYLDVEAQRGNVETIPLSGIPVNSTYEGVNPVSEVPVGSSHRYVTSNEMSITVNGTINLSLDGTSIGSIDKEKLTAMLLKDTNFMRDVTAIVEKGINKDWSYNIGQNPNGAFNQGNQRPTSNTVG